jgi:hypothetical protein
MRPLENLRLHREAPAGFPVIRLTLLAILLSLFANPLPAAVELGSPTVVQGTCWARYDVSSIKNVPYCLVYENNGYALEILGKDAVSRRIRVESRNVDLGCRGSYPPDPGCWPVDAALYIPNQGRFPRLAELSKRLTGDCRTQYQAVSRLLSWISGAIDYHGGPDAPVAPLDVLEQRQASCVGAAELAVALIRESGIPARGVRGFLAPVSASGITSPDAAVEMSLGEEGLHRWIEIYYPGVGWVFSDPFRSVNHVSPRYLVFDLEAPPLDHHGPAQFNRQRPEMGDSVSTYIRLLERGGVQLRTDVVPSLQARNGLTIRRNRPVQFRPAFIGHVSMIALSGLPAPERVYLLPAGQGARGTAEGDPAASIRDGLFSFTDLEPGEYRLHFFSGDRVVGTAAALVHFPPPMNRVVPVVLGRTAEE